MFPTAIAKRVSDLVDRDDCTLDTRPRVPVDNTRVKGRLVPGRGSGCGAELAGEHAAALAAMCMPWQSQPLVCPMQAPEPP